MSGETPFDAVSSPASPLTIEITPCGKTRHDLPIRPSLEVVFTCSADGEDVFDYENVSSRANSPSKSPKSPDASHDHGMKSQLDSFKNKWKELSPKLRHKRKSPQMTSNSDLSDTETLTRPKTDGYRLSMQSYKYNRSMDENSDDNYFSENEKYNKRHSMSSLLKDSQPEKLTRKTGLMSSFRSLFSLSKLDLKGDKPESSPSVKHIRQSSDSMLLDMSAYAANTSAARHSAADNNRDAKSLWKVASKAHKRNKNVVLLDTSESESAAVNCLLPSLLTFSDSQQLDFEVSLHLF